MYRSLPALSEKPDFEKAGRFLKKKGAALENLSEVLVHQ
jgi:hypothetical protein